MKFGPLAICLLMKATFQSLFFSSSLPSLGVAHAQPFPPAAVTTTNLRGGGTKPMGNAMEEIMEQGFLLDSDPHHHRRHMQKTPLLLQNWAFCSTSQECMTGCCASRYSSDGRFKCTPLEGGFRPDLCVVTPTGSSEQLASVTSSSTRSATSNCGGGNYGNGICADGTCCSEFGWCGVTAEHCAAGGGTTGGGTTGGGTCGGGNRGNGICADGTCCSEFGWCGVTAEHCAAGGGTTGGGTCGGGNRGNGICADGTCCSEFGWCGVTAEHCATGGGGTGTGSGGGTTGGGNGGTVTSPAITLSTEQVQVGINTRGDTITVSPQIVDAINKVTAGYSLYQQLAFVAHTTWESGSYQYKEELDTANHGNYQDCDWNQEGVQLPENGKLFYGRGYLQLSWCANYKAYGASRMHQGDPDLFYNQPELVATDEFYAMDSAAWFFENIVTDTTGQFGLTTQAINGPLECSGGSSDKAKKRYEIFVALANSVGLTGYSESGCYN